MSKTQKDTMLTRLGGYPDEKDVFQKHTKLEDSNTGTYLLYATTDQHIAINIARIAGFAEIREEQIACNSL